MKISEIARIPVSIKTAEVVAMEAQGVHESVMRSYHIVIKVQELLEAGTPGPVVLALIDEMRNPPPEGNPLD